VLWAEFETEVETIRSGLSSVPDDVPMMDAIRVVIVAANHYHADDIPEMRLRMQLIATVPALSFSAAEHYEAWELAISEFAGRRLGQPAGSLYPADGRPGRPRRLPRGLRPLVCPRRRRPDHLPGPRADRAVDRVRPGPDHPGVSHGQLAAVTPDDLTLDCDIWNGLDGSGQRLMVLTAEPGTPSHDALRILAAWAAMQTARPDPAPQGEPNR
jgi:hypothetical protein